MDTKDVPNVGQPGLLEGVTPIKEEKTPKLQPLSSLRTSQVSSQAVSVKIELTSQASQTPVTEIRGRANQTIDIINVASEAAQEIENLVKGIDGIVGQADRLLQGDKEEPEQQKERVPLLEQEANQLIGAIKKLALAEAPNGVRPLSGEKIRLEIEEKIGKSLEVILPDEAANAFGLSDVSLSTVDSIVNARANVAEARQRIQQIRRTINDTYTEVKSIVNELEVAFQNNEASRASIRDVDEALKVVEETSKKISGNPDDALKASRLNKASLNLLEG